MKDAIPKKFYRGGQHPVVTSVGELKAQLAQLPDAICGLWQSVRPSHGSRSTSGRGHRWLEAREAWTI